MESLFYEFDHELSRAVTPDNPFVLMDAVSLLWRLNVMEVEVGEERWKRVTDALATYSHHHRSPWLVSIRHYYWLCLGILINGIDYKEGGIK